MKLYTQVCCHAYIQYVYINIHVYIYIHIYICICIYVFMYLCICICEEGLPRSQLGDLLGRLGSELYVLFRSGLRVGRRAFKVKAFGFRA